MMFNNWYRKEQPIQGMMGMGGGATGYLTGGGGPTNLGTLENPAIRSQDLIDAGITDNGYYYLKGTGANDPARPYYVFLDPNFTLGAGWIVIANHDAQKRPNTAHQARPTGNTNYIGYDQNSSSNYNDYPTTSVMVPNVSFSQDASKLVWREFVHAAYGTGPSNQDADINSDTWLTIQAYYYGSFTSDQTIGTSGTWVKTFSSSGGRVNSYSRRLQYDNSYACHSIGVMNNSSGSSPRVYGSNASTQNYPVYVGSWIGDPTNNGYQGTFSWCDENGQESTSNPSGWGWDDWQDGSGMGDQWSVEGQGGGAYRGYPSFILVK